ncbi:hypothetical protein [Streptomyces kaempferi]|uniref:GIY-YIG domain-containing protein n=1 Tax=Streptomyces kaempferi TaxID=333725 RepID=A0ABW3XMT9_9ACTN
MPETPERTALYRFFDPDGTLLYVGITNSPSARFSQHARDAALTWWPAAASSETSWYTNRLEAALAEVRAIREEKPLHNKRHALDATRVSDRPRGPFPTVDQDDLVTFSEMARRAVALGYAASLTRNGLIRIARSDPLWPVPQSDWCQVSGTWLFSWAVVEPFFRNREAKRRRGADREPKRFEAHRLHGLALKAFGDQPFSRSDLMERLGVPEGTVRVYSRRLAVAGRFRVAGKRKPAVGRPQILYVAVPDPE